MEDKRAGGREGHFGDFQKTIWPKLLKRRVTSGRYVGNKWISLLAK